MFFSLLNMMEFTLIVARRNGEPDKLQDKEVKLRSGHVINIQKAAQRGW